MVPAELVLALWTEYESSDVDGFWRAWSAYCRAGGPTTAGAHAFFCRGAVRIRRRRLGGRSAGSGGGTGASSLYRVGQGDGLMLRLHSALPIPHLLP